VSDLPSGWCWSTLGEIAEVSGGLTKNASKRNTSSIQAPLVSVAAVQLRTIAKNEIGTIGLLPEDGERGALKEGDLLMVEGNGSLSHIGRVALWDASVPDARHQNHIIRIRPHEVSPQFLLEWLASPAGRNAIVGEATSATGLYTLSISKVERLPVPLPPHEEQRRIISKLESLLARSRRAKEALDAIPALLERFRQSVLAAAFRGDLTADWRAQHPDIEPASKLLERIRAERRLRWEEAELEKMRAKGKVPTNDAWKSRYEEPHALDTAGLPPLPRGWCWASADSCAWETTVGHVGPMKEQYVSSGVPFLRSQNVRENRFDARELRYIPQEFHEKLPKSALRPGDLVIVRSGAPGTACVIPPDLADANCSDLVIVRLVKSIDPNLISYFINSDMARSRIVGLQVGVAQQHFNIGAMRGLPIPVMPEAEQRILTQRIQQHFAGVDRIKEASLASEQKQADLERALLAKAFRGELVPQDPNDEPASVLLERIRAEREAHASSAPKRSRGRSSAA
jgi:type I restriction enzyme S subunit